MLEAKTFSYIGLAILVFCGHANLKYTDCGVQTGVFEKVELIPPCDTAVCTLPSGQNVTIKLTFKSMSITQSVKVTVHGILGVFPIHFPLPNSDACQDSGLICPLMDGTTYQYHNEMPILSSYPKLAVTIQYQLVDEKGVDIICVKIPVQIV